MFIRKAFKFKLNPTDEQAEKFRQFAGACRWVWNWALADRKTYYAHTGKSLSYNEQFKRLTEQKSWPETEWLNDIHSQVLQEPIKQLRRAFKNFFEGRAHYPKFKSKKNVKQAFTYPQGIKVDGNQVYLPKIGWVHFFKSREIEGTIKRATVSRKASGWYVSIQVEVETEDPEPVEPTPENTIGLDAGLTDFIVASNGEHIKAPKFLRRSERKLRREQRKLSRKQRGSKRWHKQKQIVAELHEHVANQRKDWLHKLSSEIIGENQVVIVEDLAVNGLARTRLAKSIHDAGIGEFFRQLDYKSRWNGGIFHQIDRFFPSTKLHRDCRTLNDVSLSDRVFACQGCGEIINRDENAASNIKHQGLIELSVALGGNRET